MTKFLIIGDLHGNKPNIYFKENEFDAIIFSGDVCSDKSLRNFTDKWVASWGKTDTPYSDWQEYLDEYGRIKYEKIEEDSVKEGNKILKFLDSFGKPVFFVPGNWDYSYGKSKIKDGEEDKSTYHRARKNLDLFYGKTNKKLIRGLKNLVDCQFKLHKFKDFNILGYGISSAPERNWIKSVKDKKKMAILKKAYDKIKKKLNEEFSKGDKNKPAIFLSHNMPYKTKMDKIIKRGSVVNGKHYGSTITKDFIKEKSPLVCIGGHMHEYYGKEKVGKTTLINCGFGPKVNTLLEVEEGKIKKIKFVNKERRRDVNRRVGW